MDTEMMHSQWAWLGVNGMTKYITGRSGLTGAIVDITGR